MENYKCLILDNGYVRVRPMKSSWNPVFRPAQSSILADTFYKPHLNHRNGQPLISTGDRATRVAGQWLLRRWPPAASRRELGSRPPLPRGSWAWASWAPAPGHRPWVMRSERSSMVNRCIYIYIYEFHPYELWILKNLLRNAYEYLWCIEFSMTSSLLSLQCRLTDHSWWWTTTIYED